MSPEALLHTRRLSRSVAEGTRLHLLRSGVHLGLFEGLRRPHGEAELARRLGLAEDLTAAWLRAAHAHRLLRRDRRGRYALRRFTRWLLDAPESAHLHALVDHALLSYGPVFERLPELLKGAERPEFGAPEEARRTASVSRLLERRALAALARVPGADAPRRVLDVGCGEGTYLAGLLLRYRETHGLGVEKSPEVAEEARRQLREAEVSRRGDVRVGDFMSMDLPAGTFDLILLNNNLYYFPPVEHRALFERARERLAPGGSLAIQVPVPVRGGLAARLGLAATNAALDLFLRCHRNLHGLPDPEVLRDRLREDGFAAMGEVAILPGGASRYVWARPEPGAHST